MQVSKQVDISPKGEFETTPEYQARQKMGNDLRKRITQQFEPEKISSHSRIQKQIRELLDIDFPKPAAFVLGVYDADTQKFPVTLKIEGKQYDDFLFVPRLDAKLLKDNMSVAKSEGIWALAMQSGHVEEYFWGIKVRYGTKEFSNVPPLPKPTTKQELQYKSVYREPTVIYLRKALNAFLLRKANEEDSESLSQVDSDYFQSKFIVFSINPHLGGGKLLSIIFVDRPDAMFDAWVYLGADGYSVIRSIELVESDPAKMRKLRSGFKLYLRDTANSI